MQADSPTNPPNAAPTMIQAWYQAARPRSLAATYSPLILAGAIALVDGVFDLARFALSLLGALLLQIGANLVNEYVDYARGTDARKVDGMGMVLTRAQLTPKQVLIAAIATVSGGILIGLLLTALDRPLLLWVGIGGVFAAVFYTAGPLPLAYLGLGDIAVFLAFGPAMIGGAYYAMTGQINPTVLLSSLPLAFTVTAILHANNMRDIESDKQAGKRTLAVRFGMRGAQIEYAILIYGAYVATLALVLLRVMPWTTLVAAITLPRAIRLVRQATSTDDPQILHRVQGMTAQLHLYLGLMLAAGWLIYAILRSWTVLLSR
jgi:1,4-dihydroxy-2-naphthoate octaprenyltransferase